MNQTYTNAVLNRRSIYTLHHESPVSREVIVKEISDMLLHVPSAFNSQSAKVVLLFDNAHYDLWDIVLDTLKPLVDPERFPATRSKISTFSAAYGTVLYFDDTAITDELIQQFPAYADNFNPWAEQANGMLQFAVWTMFSSMGLGASLQHYNPLIDEKVKARFDIPASWRLRAQMPFGAFDTLPPEKDKLPIEERLIIRA